MMDKLVRRILWSLLPAALVGCAGLETLSFPGTGDARQLVRIQAAHSELAALNSVDVLIELDNELLRARLQSIMDELTGLAEAVDFTAIEVKFQRQFIALDGRARVVDTAGQSRAAELEGDIQLVYTANRLVWVPRFDRLSLGAPVVQDPADIVDPEAGHDPGLLNRINEEMGWNLYGLDRYYLEIDPMPMGVVEAGAALTREQDVLAAVVGDLGGVFTTEGSALLIDRDTTRIALDLNFVPSVFSCPADVSISRSLFAREIQNREPVGAVSVVEADAEIQHFFTEVTGARRSTAVIHYWFADGRPASVVELPVEPSSRWRTWSSRPPGHDGVRNWEVLVVEKGTGCILESASILAAQAGEDTAPQAQSSTRQAFRSYQSAFGERLAGFTPTEERAGPVRIEVRRAFLAETFNEALKDLELVATIRINDSSEGRYTAGMSAFNMPDLRCERPECKSQRECAVNYDACPLELDTRDCTTCLFINPLNNRCVNEGQDPLCEAARAAINKRKERDREICVRNAQAERDACERLRAQEIRSCELEASTDLSACQARREQLRELQAAGTVAQVVGTAQLSGEASVSFSGFRIEGDFERINMGLDLRADLGLDGRIDFEPSASLGSLAPCVAAWRGDYTTRVTLPRLSSNLQATLTAHSDRLTSEWSGFVQQVGMSPSPLESLFVSNPALLASCQLGLGVEQVAAEVTGADGDFFRGQYGFSVQPLPTRIRLLSASLSIDDENVRTGRPELGTGSLVYTFEN